MGDQYGWIKLHRKTLDNPVVMKDAETFAIWIYLLLKATHEDYPVLFGGKKITLKPGQLVTGRKAISSALSVSEWKVYRSLACLESEQQIAQQKSSQNTLITVVNWDLYQNDAQQFAQQMHNNCTTNAQQLHTNKNIRNKEDKNIDIYRSVVGYLNEKAGTNYRATSAKTQKLIHARIEEGFTEEDFRKVINNKCAEWKGTEFELYLRPETLFGTKFEGYLNQKETKHRSKPGNGANAGYSQTLLTDKELDALFTKLDD